MRTPEKCPWCGAEENIRPDGVRTGTYQCTWRIGARQSWCNRFASRAAQEYRQALAWRKLLSQHTGVPLRLVMEPSFVGKYACWAELDVKVLAKRTSGSVVWLGYKEIGWSKTCKRDEARRRLLAKGE